MWGNIYFSFYILFSNKDKLVILVLPFKRKMRFSMSSLSEYEAMSCPVTPISGCMRPGRASVSYDFYDRAAVLLAFFSTAPFRGSSVLLFPFPVTCC